MDDIELAIFEPKKGINCNSLNANFDKLKIKANSNESELSTIAFTALKKDGSNIEQSAIDKFQQSNVTILEWASSISLADNSTNFLTLQGNTSIILPPVQADGYSHTIVLIVQGSNYTLNLGNIPHLVSTPKFDGTKPYSILFVFNPIDAKWYYCLGQ